MTNRPPARRPLRFSALDFKVGFRMLGRYPGLTVVGTLAMAVAIALGTVYFAAVDKFMNPRLPIADAERVVSIHNWDMEATRPETRSLYDFARWREQARTVRDLGAAVPFVRNLEIGDRTIEPVIGAEVTPEAFRVMGTPPLLGRVLTAQDARPEEPPVVVIGHALWESRFDADSAVLGRTVRLGTTTAVVVGVMPPGFAFPSNHHVWAPLRTDGATLAPRTGPTVSIFGRLAPGASLDGARAELATIAARVSAESPETHEHLRPRVTNYAKPLAESGPMAVVRNVLYLANLVFLLLLAIICANVATLVLARTATRGWEITVRSALGASRGRIVAQLFIEALVLAGLAAVVGLAIAKLTLRFGVATLVGNEAVPFWIDDSLSWKTTGYAAALAVVGATIVGVLPALRVTRINVQDALRDEGAARSGLKFGGVWTAVIVLQVAITVALLPLAAGGVSESNRFRQRAEGIGAERYVAAELGMDREDHALDSAAFAVRARVSLDELARRLRAEPGVEAVAFADRLPVEDQFKYRIELDTALVAPVTDLRTSTLVNVSDGFFDAFGSAVVAGRDFVARDYEDARVLLVNQSFVRHVLGGRNAVGQRVRILGGEIDAMASDDWYEIVGVVRDFGWQLPQPHEQSAMYRPSLPLVGHASQLAVRARDPAAVAPRLAAIAAEVDPTVRVTGVRPLADVGGGEAQMNWTLTAVAWLVALTVLLLSATGIHALVAFTVSRRTREIGIRVALGAQPGRIVRAIFSRVALQVGLGVLIGSALAMLVGFGSTQQMLLLLGADVVMLLVGLAACAVPLRRALRVQPTEALRAEG